MEILQKRAMTCSTLDMIEERLLSKSFWKCGSLHLEGHEGLWKKDSVKVTLRAWSEEARVHRVLSLAVHDQSIPKQQELGPRAPRT